MPAARIAIVVAAVLGLVVAHQLGVLDQFAEPQRVRDALLRLEAWGYVAFIVAYALLQPFGVPGTVFVFAAPLVWPWPVAFALSMTGTMAASVVGFSFARFVARDWIAQRIPERFHQYDAALSRQAFKTVFWLRFVFWMPPLLHAFFGVSSVSFAAHFWGSVAGYALPLLAVSYFGQRLFDWLIAAPPAVWVGLGVATVLVVAAAWWIWRRRRAA